MKDWHKDWKSFCAKPIKPYSRTKLCPTLWALHESQKLLACTFHFFFHLFSYFWLFISGLVKWKKHFLHVANNCNGDEVLFRKMFIASADHYATKFKIPPDEVILLKKFLEKKFLGKDLRYYVHGTYTSFCESFHALANKLCPKALVKNFDFYWSRKECAGIQWNINIWERLGTQKPIISIDYRFWIAEEAVKRTHGGTLLKADEQITEAPLAKDFEVPEDDTEDIDSDEVDK